MKSQSPDPEIAELERFAHIRSSIVGMLFTEFFDGKRNGNVPTSKELMWAAREYFQEENDRNAFFFNADELLAVRNALVTTRPSDLGIEDFHAPPDMNSPLLTVSKWMIFGLDFKITENGEIKLIEINGLNSGMKGFARMKLDSETPDGPHRADRALGKYINSFGERQNVYMGTVLASKGTGCWRLQASRELARSIMDDSVKFVEALESRGVHPDWKERILPIIKEVHNIESLVKNKFITDKYLEDVRDIKPHSYLMNAANLENLLQTYSPEYVVVKPLDGSIGREVKMFRPDEARQLNMRNYMNMIAEPFIPSVPIYSPTTKLQHDGCMRYVVVAEENICGVTRFRHFGGYWRLCPRPIHEYGNVDAMRANLHQKAVIEKASEEHLELAQVAADIVLESVWPKFSDPGEDIYSALFNAHAV